jgi:hypothetical protein
MSPCDGFFTSFKVDGMFGSNLTRPITRNKVKWKSQAAGDEIRLLSLCRCCKQQKQNKTGQLFTEHSHIHNSHALLGRYLPHAKQFPCPKCLPHF